MTFKEFLKNNLVILDGGMGTLLQECGLKPGEQPERWNLTHPDVITKIHQDYFDAGSHVVTTNTFGANTLKFSVSELEEIVKAAIENAKVAREKSTSKQEKFIALDIGPSGKLLSPFGDLDFEDAVSLFKETILLGTRYGADLIIIETMGDCYETKAALLAAKENSDLPVMVSNAYGESKKLMTGASPAAMVAMVEGMGADVIGANCSFGPKQLKDVLTELLENASLPVAFMPNAGLPVTKDGQPYFDVTVDEFADEVLSMVQKGVRLVGGCCGTTPAYIKAISERTASLSPVPLTNKNFTVVSSGTEVVKFGDSPVLIGERINPTGKKRFKQALLENDMDYILEEGIRQQEKGVHILDVNVGHPEIDEAAMLENTVNELQAIVRLPLELDTSDIHAMEKALRRYNGKAMINSVNGKKESMEAIFPLVQKYGGVVVALTLDENGIPETAEARVQIAKKILATAAEYGISQKDIIFDTLTMAVSADPSAADTTLKALRQIKTELGCHTILGVSNVSFGLPNRDAVNGTFFSLALENGLSAAIMNPFSLDIMKTYYTYRALMGLDQNFAEYLKEAESFTSSPKEASTDLPKASLDDRSALQKAIVKGLSDKARTLTGELLKSLPPLDIVQNEIIPALDIVGKGFEQKTVYLPQLLMSAEAAKAAFSEIKANMPQSGEKSASKGTFIIATVHGDIHDIGKNIVKLLLENYGFHVVDLGKDVAPETIVEAVVKYHAPLVGLSALMTTTVPAMAETIQRLKAHAPWCKTVVGGAVLTKDYANQIGADHYAKDAMEAVRYAETVMRLVKEN